MDNLGSHKGHAARRLIRSVGAKLFFLPRYSPDLYPIEQVFAKLKPLLRKADPRTIETTWREPPGPRPISPDGPPALETLLQPGALPRAQLHRTVLQPDQTLPPARHALRKARRKLPRHAQAGCRSPLAAP